MNRSNRASEIKKCIIITGMSGGGKSSALTVFEDQGYYAIDNLPPTLLPQLIEVLKSNQSAVTSGVAAVVDVREEELLNDLHRVVAKLHETIEDVETVFVEASDEALVRRFETTRRRHPLAKDTTLLESIASERKLLRNIKECSDIVLDTTEITTGDFKNKLLEIIGATKESSVVIFSSFGFKNGIPQDADYIIDVRFLPNPNYIPELHSLTGLDEQIQNYFEKYEDFHKIIEYAVAMLNFVASVYGNTGKKHLHIAIGCTGGRHRSVAVCERLASKLREAGKKVVVNHRDITKENVW